MGFESGNPTSQVTAIDRIEIGDFAKPIVAVDVGLTGCDFELY
jgi:hypothetical protein